MACDYLNQSNVCLRQLLTVWVVRNSRVFCSVLRLFNLKDLWRIIKVKISNGKKVEIKSEKKCNRTICATEIYFSFFFIKSFCDPLQFILGTLKGVSWEPLTYNFTGVDRKFTKVHDYSCKTCHISLIYLTSLEVIV